MVESQNLPLSTLKKSGMAAASDSGDEDVLRDFDADAEVERELALMVRFVPPRASQHHFRKALHSSKLALNTRFSYAGRRKHERKWR